MSEHQHQSMLVRWFRLQHPKNHKHLFSIPNGAHLAGDTRLRAIKMAKMKETGLLPGVSDLFLMIPKNGWHGLFIEMKSEKGTVSEEQRDFLGNATLMGYQGVICFGFDEARAAITEYLGEKDGNR